MQQRPHKERTRCNGAHVCVVRMQVRLGASGYPSMEALIAALNKAGLGALELFCMGLKANGGCDG